MCETNEDIPAHILPGKPMSKTELEIRLLLADEDISNGNLISNEDLKKESENW